MNFEIILMILMGVGLSAACGFRIFVPFLIVSIATLSGYLTLSESFSWIGTIPALIAFSVATVLEIAAYYIPWFDNFMDTIATPIAVIAGIVLTASVVTEMSPFLKWALAIIAGGGVAATVQTLTGLTRLTSSTSTGGIANPLVSTAELGGSAVIAASSVFIPLVAGIIVVILLIWAANKFNNYRLHKSL